MKLVILLITNLAALISCQRIQQDQYPFPPQFQTPGSGMMVSDSSIYLPPESHTPMPYFSVNNMNKLPFQLLPPSGTKVPSVYPTLRPSFDDDEEEDDNDDHVKQIQITSPRPMFKQQSKPKNVTESNQEKRETRAIPKTFDFQSQPQNKMDRKQFAPVQHNLLTQEPPNQNLAARRMILTSEIQRNDDHLKSYSSSQYSQLPNIFFSSTTEPAIPILRLSNEMDLDGSFSYEALGADQTHYVQHSRMENMGSGKEEQVVEGSYSYVGDNGQTYTVHYVADSNGYRASGDHLPSPPPIPEIIQRAIQYNLAEEARRPPHLRGSWEENDSERENSGEDKEFHYPLPPTRNLFTGRTPEAFSYGFSPNGNIQNNQPVTSASTLIPKTSFDIAVELSKQKANSGPISPQITFAASQGNHNPSSPTQQAATRNSPNEKPSLPQIMNYEASSREIEQENKPLWRWQYGMNANSAEQNPNKDTISRSFAEGDDVIINFNDMTPQQYTDMIQSQIFQRSEGETYSSNMQKTFSKQTPNSLISDKAQYITNQIKNFNNNEQNRQIYVTPKNDIHESANKNYFKDHSSNQFQNQPTVDGGYSTVKQETVTSTSTENINTQSAIENYKKFNEYNTENKMQTNVRTDPYSGLVRQQNFLPPSQLVTRSYDYEDIAYEPKRIYESLDMHYKNKEKLNTQRENNVPPSQYWYSTEAITKTTTATPYQYSTLNNFHVSTAGYNEESSSFRPINKHLTKDSKKQEITTTERTMDELLQENIFLKNIVRGKKEENVQKDVTERKEQEHLNLNREVKIEKPTKHIQSLLKPQSEVKTLKKKLDINDVLNYIAMKNSFELGKTKPKTFSSANSYQSKATPLNFIPLRDEKEEETEKAEQENSTHRTFSQQQDELQGMIRNYKVLQRQRNSAQNSGDNQYTDSQQRHVKIFHSDSLPPLGRAGPSMKSYLPPAYL
ncbi:unnamed protein product [Leptosia nina]|uniref:Uncharacterized protein n=1 Tax=Leptosia nina TaxID=320188 RepID=A0AAV1J121_9NEOP